MLHYKHAKLSILSLIVAAIALIIILSGFLQDEFVAPSVSLVTATASRQPATTVTTRPSETLVFTPTPSQTPTKTPTATPTNTAMPTNTPTLTPTPTPTLDLAHCTVVNCDPQQTIKPLNYFPASLLLNINTPQRRTDCTECTPNQRMSEAELNALVGADAPTMIQLRRIVLSQRAFVLAPGVVYITFNDAHHVVIDLQQQSYKLRNILPPITRPEQRRVARITPSYCFSPDSLVITTGDYYALDGTNKSETGQELFFHLGRATLFDLNGQFEIDVVRQAERYHQTSVAWGGGPIFLWQGQYNFNPLNEWFTPENLNHYRNTKWAKITVALSTDHKYLMLSLSYDKTLAEHAQTILDLGHRWGIEMDKAMRFDGSENAYMAIRLGDYLVPLLWIEEPIIVNCFAIEKSEK